MNTNTHIPAFPDILSLLPHRPPIIVVDRVLAVEGLKTTTAYQVQPDTVFISHNGFSEMGMLENLAQTSFIFLNYFFSAEKTGSTGESTRKKLGFISNISRFELIRCPKIGEQLKTTTIAELVFDSEFLKICNIQGEVMLNGQPALKADMKMLLQTGNT